MLVGGAPEQRPDHAEAVAAAALEIRATVPLLQVRTVVQHVGAIKQQCIEYRIDYMVHQHGERQFQVTEHVALQRRARQGAYL
jgi:hypothetical protein